MDTLARISHQGTMLHDSEPRGPRERVLLEGHDLGRAVPGQRRAVPWSQVPLAGSAGRKKAGSVGRRKAGSAGGPGLRIESWCTALHHFEQ